METKKEWKLIGENLGMNENVIEYINSKGEFLDIIIFSDCIKIIIRKGDVILFEKVVGKESA